MKFLALIFVVLLAVCAVSAKKYHHRRSHPWGSSSSSGSSEHGRSRWAPHKKSGFKGSFPGNYNKGPVFGRGYHG
ncbi:hypothetical protein WR25_07924 [Diploscapter pachys]|uniref:Uncharacterized protein n=1 Tax=Diploscapter pachys TaxID=2018661 RepID=A0A2A2L0T6_9BILA|nr:hypothetical protein WR25_07924 [Diploscapter pachys]